MITDTTAEAARIIERLEAEGQDFHTQVRTLVYALALNVSRVSGEGSRAIAGDELVSMLRLTMGIPSCWPSPSRQVVDGALAEAEGQGEGAVMGFCPTTRQPFTIAFDADGQPVRFSVGRPRTEIEQAEAERRATRAVFRERGLREVNGDDDSIH